MKEMFLEVSKKCERLEYFKKKCLRNGWDQTDFLFKRSIEYSDGNHSKYYCIHNTIKNEFENLVVPKLPGKDSELNSIDYVDPISKRIRTTLKEKITDDELYNIAVSLYGRVFKSYANGYNLCGGLGIKSEIGDNPVDIVLSLRKVPGYFKGACIDRIDPEDNYTLVHPIHKEKVWHDDNGRPCLGNLRWVTYAELNSRKSVNESKKTTLESLYKIPRSFRNLDNIFKRCGYNKYDFVFMAIDNTKMSHNEPTLYRVFSKSFLKTKEGMQTFNDYLKRE